MTSSSLLRGAALLCLATPLLSQAAAPSVNAGEKLYQTYCATCHGAKLEGAEGPSLIDQTWIHGAPTKSNLIKLISKGVADKGMPAWSQVLSAAQIGQLADYIGTAPKTVAAAPAKPSASADTNNLAGLKLPKGFRIAVYADHVDNARSMTVSDSGIVYVGSRKAGKIYALVDDNQDGVADKVVT
ncbi:MAG: cytochrome c, partial [Burkholderiaceae bacterium]|nr:cytochrome c [Burkholderiaceae bacterium]